MKIGSDSLRRYLLIGLIAIFCCANISFADSKTLRTKYIVRVYSDGVEVAKYYAIDEGRVDGSCFIFHIKKGIREVEIRVCGTYIVEEV